ncbi:MAG: class C sortase [Oscillospiraceae bacterium]|nr:class C sortase [Oscillospiraceae bacterium]
MKKKITTVILVLILLVGLCIMLYPIVSNYWNSLHQSRVITDYAEHVSKLDKSDYDKILASAHQYNKELASKGVAYKLDASQQADYEKQLDAAGTGIMGYIEIPKINCSLAIYHGTSDAVLQIGVGHIEGTSLPVGGIGTHCVVSGHRGLPSAKLFTNLDNLEVGDVFMMRILNETLTYEVDQVLIVLPSDTEALSIDPKKDYCTLVTCTPYAVNTHRLLVRGHRIENLKSSDDIKVTSDAVQIDPMIIAPIVAVPILILLVIAVLTRAGSKTRKAKRKKESDMTSGSDGDKDSN